MDNIFFFSIFYCDSITTHIQWRGSISLHLHLHTCNIHNLSVIKMMIAISFLISSLHNKHTSRITSNALFSYAIRVYCAKGNPCRIRCTQMAWCPPCEPTCVPAMSRGTEIPSGKSYMETFPWYQCHGFSNGSSDAHTVEMIYRTLCRCICALRNALTCDCSNRTFDCNDKMGIDKKLMAVNCWISWLTYLNLAEQMSHTNFFTPLCTTMWLR